MDEQLQQDIIMWLNRDHGINEENGKLAILLSEEKQNLEDITKPDNPVEVLIFKQAIALGWDCPRSHILALFREWSNVNFSIQTLGRIMRVADPEQGHYTSDYEILNHAYVFTNLSEIVLADDISKSYVTIHKKREKNHLTKSISIPSWYRVRQREKTRLSPLFRKVFKEESEGYNLAQKIDKDDQTVQKKLIPESIIEKH